MWLERTEYQPHGPWQFLLRALGHLSGCDSGLAHLCRLCYESYQIILTSKESEPSMKKATTEGEGEGRDFLALLSTSLQDASSATWGLLT